MIELLKPIIQFAANVLLIYTLWLGLTFDPQKVKYIAQHRILGRTLLLTLLVVPLLTIAVLKLIPSPSSVGVVMIALFAVSPGVPLMANGPQKTLVPASTSAAMSLILTVASIVMLPVWLTILDRLFPQDLSVDPGTLIRTLFVKIFAPFLVGWAVRSAAPNFAAKSAPFVERLFKITLVLIGIILVVASLRVWPKVSIWGYMAMFIIIGFSVYLGDLFGRPRLDDRALLATTAINGNPLIVMAVIQSSFPDLKVMPVLAVYFLLRILASLPYNWLLKREIHGNEVPIEASAH
jgi:predicted Na+-dependent transporter